MKGRFYMANAFSFKEVTTKTMKITGMVDTDAMTVDVDGEQHFKPSRYSKDPKNNVNRFNLVKKRDDIKNKYCIDKNIRLLRIPYWDFDNIEQILSKELGLIA